MSMTTTTTTTMATARAAAKGVASTMETATKVPTMAKVTKFDMETTRSTTTELLSSTNFVYTMS